MSKGYKSTEICQGFLLLCNWNQPAERFEEERTCAFGFPPLPMVLSAGPRGLRYGLVVLGMVADPPYYAAQTNSAASQFAWRPTSTCTARRSRSSHPTSARRPRSCTSASCSTASGRGSTRSSSTDRAFPFLLCCFLELIATFRTSCSVATQMGKPAMISKEDFIVRNASVWHRQPGTMASDSGLSAMVELLRIVVRRSASVSDHKS